MTTVALFAALVALTLAFDEIRALRNSVAGWKLAAKVWEETARNAVALAKTALPQRP